MSPGLVFGIKFLKLPITGNLAGCQGGRAGQCLECMCLLVSVPEGLDRAEKCEAEAMQSTDRRADIGKGRGRERGKRTECLCGTLSGMMLQPVQICLSSRSLVTPSTPSRANLIVLARMHLNQFPAPPKYVARHVIAVAATAVC